MNQKNTLQEARAYLFDKERFEEGSDCPCCTQRVQLYNMKLSAGQTRGLLTLYKLDKEKPNQYFNIRDIEQYRSGFGGGAFAKCKHWGLAVDKVNEDTGKRTSGLWAITEKGRQFVEGRIYVPASVKLYNKKKRGDGSGRVSIKDTLGTKFDYAQLMGMDIKENNQERLI